MFFASARSDFNFCLDFVFAGKEFLNEKKIIVYCLNFSLALLVCEGVGPPFFCRRAGGSPCIETVTKQFLHHTVKFYHRE